MLLLAAMMAAGPLCASEAIPASLQKERYEELWMNSPFTRSLNVAANYVMTGMALIDNKPIVTVRNTATGERFSLSTEPNAMGWRLLNIRPNANPRNIVARIQAGEDEITVRFDDEQLTEKALIKGAMGNAPVNPRPVQVQSGTNRQGQGNRRQQQAAAQAGNQVGAQRQPGQKQPAAGERVPREQGRKRNQNPQQ